MAKSFVLKNLKILNAENQDESLHDIRIENGIIQQVDSNIDINNTEVWDLQGALACPGFFDIGTQIGDPGFEHKEDLQSAAAAAASGGFTGLACFPNTNPVIHSKSEVLYIRNAAQSLPVDIHPIGAISRNCEGMEITEMYDMRSAGAVAFSDGLHSIQHSGVLMRALLYVKPFDGLVINCSLDEQIASKGMLHEGITSTSLGLKGIPAIAEALNVQREIYLTAYTDSRLHFHLVSSAAALDLIRKAKADGLNVTASVSPLHLIFTDEDLSTFNNNLKVMPPIRSNSDREALIEGLLDGTIDMISSGHVPQDQESKQLEFAYSQFGAISLETCFSMLYDKLGDRIPLNRLIDALAIQPRKILSLPIPKIEVGASADLCFLDIDSTWTRDIKTVQSKSLNDPLLGQSLKGKIKGIFAKGQTWKA